jgi:hypothetical protein
MHSVKASQYAPGRHKQCSDGEEEGYWETARLPRRSRGKCQHTSLPPSAVKRVGQDKQGMRV